MPAKPTEQRPQLTDNQIQQIADIFDEVDEDRDGFITRRQLSELLERLEISVELQKKLNRHLEQLGMTSKDVLSRVEVLKVRIKLCIKFLNIR
jgi:Ca2+-binding EF-hand superfamily protein